MRQKGNFVPKLQPAVIVPYEEMKNKIGVIVPYMQPGTIVPCEDMQNKIRVIVPYMQSRGYCALWRNEK